jgi:predicted transcriptional regulator
VAEVLRLLTERHANQIPVSDGTRIVGAVTRQNLLQAIEVQGQPGVVEVQPS